MILPTKHIQLSNSILNVGAIIIKNLNENSTVSLLWEKTKKQPGIKTFDRFILGLTFLYSMGLIEIKEGLITKIK